jgi:hypothetical protein
MRFSSSCCSQQYEIITRRPCLLSRFSLAEALFSFAFSFSFIRRTFAFFSDRSPRRSLPPAALPSPSRLRLRLRPAARPWLLPRRPPPRRPGSGAAGGVSASASEGAEGEGDRTRGGASTGGGASAGGASASVSLSVSPAESPECE